MVERFGDAALRHLETAEILLEETRMDDAAYHYGLVGEMALKEAFIRAVGTTLPTSLRRHINQQRPNSLQTAVQQNSQLIGLLSSGRLGALGAELTHRLLAYRFTGWSIDIRYADDALCPVKDSDVDIWKADAVALYNNGVF